MENVMIRKNCTVRSYIISIIILTGILFISKPDIRMIDSETGATKQMDSQENPTGLAPYEYMRLRNPETGKIPRGIGGRENRFIRSLPTVEEAFTRGLRKRSISYGWKSRGPSNIGGRTRAFGLDIRDENIILGGGASGGMWKSTDNGQTWIKTTKPDQLHTVSCLVQDTRPGREDTWYQGTGEYSGGQDHMRGNVPYDGNGIYKSTDNGDTWELLASTSTGMPENHTNDFDWIHKVAIDPSNLDDDEVYAAAYGAIYRSPNGGQSWSRVLGGPGRAAGWAHIAVTSTGVVYATLCYGPDQGLYRSENGILWTNITPPNWPSYFHRVVIAIAPSNENIVYFFTETTRTWLESTYNGTYCLMKYTYLSGNGSGNGGTWENRSQQIFHNYCGLGWCMDLNVLPTNENRVFLGRQSLHRSRDGFATLSGINLIGDADLTFLPDYGFHCDLHKMIFSRQDPRIAYVSHDGGISKTTNITANTVNWTSLEYGYKTSQYYTVAIVPDIAHDPRIMGGMHDNGSYLTTSANPNSDWKFLYFGDGAHAAFLDGGSKMIVSWQEGNIFMGTIIPDDMFDPGDWTRINPYIENPLFIHPFAVDPNNDKCIYMPVGNLLKKCPDITVIPLNGSQSHKSNAWQTITTVPTIITALSISKEPAHVLYFGTVDGRIYRIDDATSGHPVPVNIYTNKGLPVGGYLSHIAIDPHDADHAVVTFSNYGVQSIFSTTNGGNSWTHVSGNLEENTDGTGSGPAVNWIAILPENGQNTYFACTSAGLFSTTQLDGIQTTWAQEGASTIGNVKVSMAVAREIDGEVVVATYGNGVYSRDFSTPVEGQTAELPMDFQLMQNYPNPFNPATSIRYQLPNTSDVRLSIYNSLGQHVRTLVNTRQNGGLYTVTWDSCDDRGMAVGSGVYIYRLCAGDKVVSKKMMLMR